MPTADELIGPDVLGRLIEVIGGVVPGNALGGLRARVGSLGPLSLRERSDLLKDALLEDLPGDYDSLARTFRAALAEEAFTGWMIWPVSEAVTARALSEGTPAAFDDALALLSELTPRLTGEFAIRPLLQADLGRALDIVRTWTSHPDENVRRLASEGTRPFLPWAKRVPAILERPEGTVPIIDALYRDTSEYVRRSVANHLNDLSRQQPELVTEVAARWLAEPDENTGRVVRHALRTLIKKGHPAALALLGFEASADVAVTGPVLGRAEVAVGESLPFRIELENTGGTSVAVAVDYIVHHRKANGLQTAKVFKLSTKTLLPGERVAFERAHSFRPISTRVYHAGEHAIEVQVNGVASGRAVFQLTAED